MSEPLDLDAIEADLNDPWLPDRATADALVAELRSARDTLARVKEATDRGIRMDGSGYRNAAVNALYAIRETIEEPSHQPARAKCEDCRAGIDSTCPTCGCCNHRWVTDAVCQCTDRTCGCREAREDAQGGGAS